LAKRGGDRDWRSEAENRVDEQPETVEVKGERKPADLVSMREDGDGCPGARSMLVLAAVRRA
jgi:hypothetical protein